MDVKRMHRAGWVHEPPVEQRALAVVALWPERQPSAAKNADE